MLAIFCKIKLILIDQFIKAVFSKNTRINLISNNQARCTNSVKDILFLLIMYNRDFLIVRKRKINKPITDSYFIKIYMFISKANSTQMIDYLTSYIQLRIFFLVHNYYDNLKRPQGPPGKESEF